MTRRLVGPTALLVALAACGPSGGGQTVCGLAALAGATALLNEFGVPGQTLGALPEHLPGRLVARLAAGPAYPAVVGRIDSAWVVAVDGDLPADTRLGFGVLVLDPSGRVRGLMLYEGMSIEGAPTLGTVTVGAATIPLLGVQADPQRFEDSRCPFFPASVIP